MCPEEGKHQRVPLEAKLTMSGLSKQANIGQAVQGKQGPQGASHRGGTMGLLQTQYLYPLAIPMETVTLAVLEFGGGGSGR